jgi:hypothetical protein
VNCYPFIEAERACRRNVKRACELLKVSGAAFLLSSVLQALQREGAAPRGVCGESLGGGRVRNCGGHCASCGAIGAREDAQRSISHGLAK